jgi:hypothetical protein
MINPLKSPQKIDVIITDKQPEYLIIFNQKEGNNMQ